VRLSVEAVDSGGFRRGGRSADFQKEDIHMQGNSRSWLPLVVVAATVSLPASADAQSPQVLASDATRYMALGDSIAAGYKAVPVTNGYAYLLYQDGEFDRIPHTLFCDAAVPGATSLDVLQHQVPQATIPESEGGFHPRYVTLTVGGNDLLAILRFIGTHQDPAEILQFAMSVITQYGQNLGATLSQLSIALPDAKIFVANQYAIPQIAAIVPLTDPAIAAFNTVVQQVVAQFPSNVYLVDVYSTFLGRDDLLLVERHAASLFETHLTSVGHRLMEQTFANVIANNR
jgi:lysophospholipase L1-like esterase